MIFLLALAAMVYAGSSQRHHNIKGTLTGAASGNDSVFNDTIHLFSLPYYYNKLYGRIILDSIKDHNPSGFGLVDTVDLILKTHYAGRWQTIDSVRKVLAVATNCTLDVTDTTEGLRGDDVYLIVRIADTVGVTTDSVVNITGQSKIKHDYQ